MARASDGEHGKIPRGCDRRRWRWVRALGFPPVVALALLLGTPSGAHAAGAPPPPPPPTKPEPAAVGAVLDAVAPLTGDAGVALAMRPPVLAPLPPGPKPAAPHLSEAELIDLAGFRPEQVGYLVYDLDTGEYLAGHNAAHPAFLPASVLKVPTTVAALAILGPDHRFPTLVRFDGTRDGPVWRGTLALVGGGDPVLDSDDLRALMADLKAAGLERLDGSFVYDDSALIAAPSIEDSQPPEHSYNPGLSALSLDFNRVRVGWDGEIVRFIETHGTPPVAPVRLTRDTATTGWARPGPSLRHAFAPPGTHDDDGLVVESWRMSPHAPYAGATWLPVRAPAPFTAAVFRALADEAGIVLPDPEPARQPARGPIVASHFSPRLSAIAAAGLKHSNNLLAELVGLAATKALEGRPLPMAKSAARMTDWLAEAMPWVDWSGFYMANHSGLSPDSRASPEQIVSILRFAQDQGAALAPAAYASLLPTRRFPDRDASVVAARVRAGAGPPRVAAKSGTMYHGRGLAGFVVGKDGHRLVFALFISDLPARRAFDADYAHYAASAVRRARAQLRRARDLEHALILKWVSEH
ncbi:D-alanyl-D-alanine carboxypeptidase/D-alanyl-D-alanine-endopeptidase [uncultured Rhodospira sp.]|uniref:D-alanyl-D-alanine carboxypeptidase/D-alanyl-D-alanine endopeptidase n=1 Tax=uncultured Rhodospira sp. TaxID=1936189 RepID=UPI00262A8688|nr:D-alanyl-D-alanine carboxypeptidase/D-alanyl-D-alanine-endopeptidase [uncultured Rhodospira sp.]